MTILLNSFLKTVGDIKLYIKEKKIELAGLQPLPFLHVTASFQTKNCSAFCTANQSTNTNLKN